MNDVISTIPELEACVGAAGLPIKMKIIDHLDAEAARWIAAAPLGFVAAGGPDGPRVAVAGGPPGFAQVTDETTLRVPLNAVDPLGEVEAGQGAGVLFLIPGIGETLRANGRVRRVADGALEIAVEECFIHCAKALIRSDFWTPAAAEPPGEANAFVDASRFLALATMDSEGRVDISPKGDPAGRLIRVEDGHATLAERPGNRLAFGYRNIIEQPRVAVLCLVPGAQAVAKLFGRAVLTHNEAVRESFVVEGKTPAMATVVEDLSASLAPSEALARAAVWAGAPAANDIDPAAVLVAHLKLNKARGAQATMLRLAVNRGLIAKGLEANYRTDLY